MGPGNLSRAELQALDAVPRIARALERIADALEQDRDPQPNLAAFKPRKEEQ